MKLKICPNGCGYYLDHKNKKGRYYEIARYDENVAITKVAFRSKYNYCPMCGDELIFTEKLPETKTHKKIIELFNENKKPKDIANKLGIHVTTVYKALNKLNA